MEVNTMSVQIEEDRIQEPINEMGYMKKGKGKGKKIMMGMMKKGKGKKRGKM